MRARHAALLALIAAAATSGCDQTLAADAGSDGDADLAGDATAEADVDAEAPPDVEAAWVPGPLTLIVSQIEVLEDRLCDLDGDGLPDNVLADVGSPYSGLYAMAIDTAIAGSLDDGYLRSLLHIPWLEVSPEAMDGEATVIAYRGHDTDYPRDPTDDFSGEEPFFARAMSLDACGEPAFVWRESSIRSGRLTGRLVPLAFDLGRAGLPVSADVDGTFGPAGRSLRADACSFAAIHDLGTGFSREMTLLEALLLGGGAYGITGPGFSPNVDLDADGLERVLLDEAGHIASCIDGDGVVIEGPDCWLDPRIADGFALSFRISLVTARYAGREPGWQLAVPGRCPGGMPEESLFGDIVHEVACAGLDERCDPLAAMPCCDPDQVCSGQVEGEPRCSQRCTPVPCDYGGEPGICSPYRKDPLVEPATCQPVDNDVPDMRCASGGPGCTTEHGLASNTTCIELYAHDRMVCLESCTISSTACGSTGQHCFPLVFEDGGFCY